MLCQLSWSVHATAGGEGGLVLRGRVVPGAALALERFEDQACSHGHDDAIEAEQVKVRWWLPIAGAYAEKVVGERIFQDCARIRRQ